MHGPVYLNILLGHDYIRAMHAVVSSLFRVMKFPHEGHIITIDQLSYGEHPSIASPDRISNSVTHTAPMHYVSTSPHCEAFTPIECRNVALEQPPYPFSSEDG